MTVLGAPVGMIVFWLMAGSVGGVVLGEWLRRMSEKANRR
mgnify:CR=1 FL=1